MSRQLSLILSSLILVAVFIFDVASPLGSLEWILYLIPILMVSRGLRRADVFGITTISSVLIICGVLLSPSGGISMDVVIFNRSLGTILLWVTAYIVSQRNLTEHVLTESEERFRALVEQSITGIGVIQNGVFVYVNPHLSELFGYRSEEMIGKPPSQFVAQADQDMVRESLRRRMSGEVDSESFLFHFKRKDGTERAAEVFSRAITYKGARAFLSTLLDVTELKQAAEALKKSEKLLQTIVNTEPECVKLTDTNGRLIMMNPAGLAMIGADSMEQVKGEAMGALVDSEYRKDFEALTRGVFKGESGSLAFRITGLKGKSLWLETHAVPFRDEKNEIVALLGVSRDVTEKKRLEDDLLRAQKLESLGVLAGGIAHDFNNLLTGIMGNISFAKIYVDEANKAYERLEEAEKASERARELTQQLLTFSRGGEPVREVTSMEKIVREMSSFALRGSTVKCKVSVADDIWSAYVDSGQISQVLNNVIINAKQAMPAGGRLEISCDNFVPDSSASPALKEGKYVRVSVTDNGVGIPQDYLGKIFDPYFTTKEHGRGLGLASCYSIMKKHGGHIEVSSEVGKGSTFTLYLPSTEEKPEAPGVKEDMTGSRHGRIMIMDDEEIVRDVAGEMLKRLGYEVHFANDGAEAIEKFREAAAQQKPFDAVIMDLTVPGGMGGREAIVELRKIDPHIRAIVSSGYASDALTANYREYGFSAVLAKPYKIKDLGDTLERVLPSGEAYD